MSTDLEASFPATMQGVASALETIEEIGAALSLNVALIAKLLIIVEELATNTIKYGYGRECALPFRLRLATDTVATLIYEDDASPFDPTAWCDEDEDIPLDERPEGQAGIRMILGLSTSVTYQPRPGGNCLMITLVASTAP